ncbi:MAG: DUF2269 domain-containing protein [Magnetococcales bacterium]|nr:DUF2269 domain-containing protein [Magnetococcales bacterium]
MNTYLIIKVVHILSSVLMVGTGFGSAFYLFFTHRSRALPAIAVVSRLVVRADWWFTTPAALIQPTSGLWLAHSAGWTWSGGWLGLSLILFAVAGACWLPVVWLQFRFAAISAESVATGVVLPDHYWRYARLWERLGYVAFTCMVTIYFLMVVKPDFG